MDIDGDSSSDEEQWSRLENGEPGAFEDYLVRKLPDLRTWLRLRMGPELRAREESGDLLQSVYRRLLERRHEFRFAGEAALRGWIYTTARNLILDRHRFHGAEKRDVARDASLNEDEAFGSALTASRIALAREEARRLEAAFDGLPDEWREVLIQIRMMGRSHAEVGADLGRTEGAVRNVLYRALSRLSYQLGEPWSGG